MTTRWTGDDADAVREVAWVAREALAIHTEEVPHDSPRGLEYFARKRALLEYVDQERMSRSG